MKCPFCGNIDTKVTDSRAMEENSAIRRRRLCESCSERFTTYERLDTIPLTVVKRDGTREAFDRNKLIRNIMNACHKRSVTLGQVESLVNEIENACLNTMRKEIDASYIGELAMDKLKEIDEVSYVRFASVYRQFKNIDTFMEELGKMLREKDAAAPKRP